MFNIDKTVAISLEERRKKLKKKCHSHLFAFVHLNFCQLTNLAENKHHFGNLKQHLDSWALPHLYGNKISEGGTQDLYLAHIFR